MDRTADNKLPLNKSTSEGISTQVSIEANRLAAMTLGSDVGSMVNPFSLGGARTEPKSLQQLLRENKDITDSQPTATGVDNGRQGGESALKSKAACGGRRGTPRVDLQRCDGSDIVSWLRMVDLHVSNQQYSDEEWMAELPYYLQGGALALWWEVHERSTGEKSLTWASFRQELMDRFCPRSEIEVITNLRQVKYKDDIRAYIQQFSETVMQGRRPAEDVLVKRFLFGLPPDYFMTLCEGGSKTYETLSEVMCRAKDVFALKEAAAAEYIERISDHVQQLSRFPTDPVFFRTLSKLGLSVKNSEKGNERFSDRNRKDVNVAPGQSPSPQQQRFNREQQHFEKQPNRNSNFKQFNKSESDGFNQRNADIVRLICKKCGGRGHEERHCSLHVESNRRPGQTCNRCGGKEHWSRQCSTPRWFRLNNSKPQVHCVLGGDDTKSECRVNDEA